MLYRKKKCKSFSKTRTRYIHFAFSFSRIHARAPSTNSLNPKLLLFQLPQCSDARQISFLRPTAKRPYSPYPQIPQSKPTIPTNQQRSPSSNPRQRPLLLPPKCRPPTTVKISFLRPMTRHPKNQNLPYPPFLQTNIYLLPQTHDKGHYYKPQTTHTQTPSHLSLISSSLVGDAHHTKPSLIDRGVHVTCSLDQTEKPARTNPLAARSNDFGGLWRVSTLQTRFWWVEWPILPSKTIATQPLLQMNHLLFKFDDNSLRSRNNFSQIYLDPMILAQI